MNLGLAFKAFFKALKEPKRAQKFIEDQVVEKPTCESIDHSHLRLLGLLQQTGRLIDFFKEDISGFSDAQVGAAARKIHEDSNKCLEDFVTIRPVLEEIEGASIRIPQGYDATTLKIVGKVKGEPPYTGILVHRGWKAHKKSLPKKVGEHFSEVLCPAEVEVR